VFCCRPTGLAPHAALCAILLILSGCAGATNYLDRAGPRHAETTAHPATSDDGELRVVSFNVKYARRIDLAIRLLRMDDSLRHPDIVLLQEMDEAGTAAIADSLGMHWIYYPASVSSKGSDLGNAILSCWSLEADTKILLPHGGIPRGDRRIAVAATVRIDGRAFRVYCLHLATVLANGPHARRQQLATVLDDAERFPDVIIGGDFNSETVPEIALARGYTWPTRHLSRTERWWTLDHVLLKGDLSARASSVGVVRNNLKASDHHPVWMAVGLDRRSESTRRGK
jgi:endonuclease/exonuclease/phosphatase family metal-dependent hydrolase